MVLPGPGRWSMPALAAAGSLLLFLGPWLVPWLGALMSLWAPAPLVVLYHRQGRAAGRLALGLAMVGAVIWGAAFSAGAAGLYYLYYAAVALVLGEASWLGLGPARTVTLAGFAAAGALVGLIVGGALASGQELMGVWQAVWQQEMDGLARAYGQLGLDEEQAAQLGRAMTRVGYWLPRLAPGLMAAASLLLAWGNLLLARRLSRGREGAAEPAGGLRLFKVPEPMVWVLIAAGGAVWVGEGWWFWLGVNVIMVLGVGYFFQGLAVIAYWLEKKKAHVLLRCGLYALLAVEAYLVLPVALAGLFDLWFNFRRLESKPSS